MASRAMAVGVALAAVLGQFFALAHEITVRHFRCAEHGELTHIAPVSGSHHQAVSAVAALRAPESAGAHKHEHCRTALMLQTGVTSTAHRSAVHVPPPVGAPPEKVAPTRDRALLLAVAPKTSPPSV